MPAPAAGYTMEAIFRRGKNKLKPIPLGRTIPAEDIAQLLKDIRDFWTRLVVGKLSTRDALTNSTYAETVGEMWDFGQKAWWLLFGDGSGSMASGAETLGELVEELEVPRDSLIEITCAKGAETFVFPWVLMHPPTDWQEPVDAQKFWGLAYMVEQTIGRGANDLHLADSPVRIVSLVDPGFAGTVDHAKTLAEATGGRSDCTEVSDGDTLRKRLADPDPAQLYYFFCHGFTPGDDPTIGIDALKLLREQAESLPDHSMWDKLLDRLEHKPQEATIFFGSGELSEGELRKVKFFNGGRRPIVFLNMCHSADLMPGMGRGLTRLFMKSDASAVIGTECPMTAVFADRFGYEVLTQLTEGATAGQAVLDARRHFHEGRNPLGFAYTLYGRSDARLGPDQNALRRAAALLSDEN